MSDCNSVICPPSLLFIRFYGMKRRVETALWLNGIGSVYHCKGSSFHLEHHTAASPMRFQFISYYCSINLLHRKPSRDRWEVAVTLQIAREEIRLEFIMFLSGFGDAFHYSLPCLKKTQIVDSSLIEYPRSWFPSHKWFNHCKFCKLPLIENLPILVNIGRKWNITVGNSQAFSKLVSFIECRGGWGKPASLLCG